MPYNVNIKTPIYQYDQLKNLLENMTNDGNSYNSQMKLVETKYKELFNANRPLAGQYVRMRDDAAKTLGGFYENVLKTLKKVLTTTIEHNLKVMDLSTKLALESRSPEFFRGDTLKRTLQATTEAITLFGLTGQEGRQKSPEYQSQMKSIGAALKETQSKLAKVMLKEQRLGKEKYTGADKEKIRPILLKNLKSSIQIKT